MEYRKIPFGSPLYHVALDLRDRVMRRPLGLVLTAEDMLDEDRQFHFAAIDSAGGLHGVVVAKPLTATLVKLRAMAVAPAFQGQGIGRALIRFAESVARHEGFSHAELNARISAKGFYEKLTYKAVGPQFLQIGLPHIKMVRDL